MSVYLMSTNYFQSKKIISCGRKDIGARLKGNKSIAKLIREVAFHTVDATQLMK